MSTPSGRTRFGTLKRLIIWAILLTTWEAAYRALQWRPSTFPAPSHVAGALLNMLNLGAAHPGDGRAGRESLITSPLVVANVASLARLAVGFAISIALGGLLGLAMWRVVSLDEFLGPLLLGLQTLPSVCWVPLAILALGVNETAVLFVLVMGSVFAVSLSFRDGLRTIPPLYRRAGLMLGARGWKLYRYVLLPASLPALASSLRQGFSFAWRSLMGAEVLFAVERHGLGFLLSAGRHNVAQVVAVMTVMVVIGMLADTVAFARIERAVHHRFGLAAAR